ncbi:hypothetical protein [Lysinibacillus xylanilyticus]|uniref:hypothetical protein n=1 Tax=Lysinibacillus xylanilyticus TaxID=582475 RepID=UPI003D00A29D
MSTGNLGLFEAHDLESSCSICRSATSIRRSDISIRRLAFSIRRSTSPTKKIPAMSRYS